MKKIIAGLLAGAMTVGAAFAIDTSASVYMTGNLAFNSDGSTHFINVYNTNQKDSDLLQFSLNGDKAGASFRLWTNLAGTDSDSSTYVYMRSAVLWFKPIDMLKISVGNVGTYLYMERLHWWKTPVGGKASYTEDWDKRWSDYCGVEGGGISLALTPIKGLTFTLSSAPGFDTDNDGSVTGFSIAKNGDLTYNDWGATVKYQISKSFSVATGWRDMGSDGSTKSKGYVMSEWEDYYKLLTVGFDYSGNGFYGFIQPRILFSQYYDLEAISFDNYIKYSSDAFTLQGRFPFIYRVEESGEDDPSYLIYEVKASYAMDGFTPYVVITNDDVNYVPLTFGTAANGDSLEDSFAIEVKPGVTMTMGAGTFDVGVAVYSNVKGSDPSYGWAIPIDFRVNF